LATQKSPPFFFQDCGRGAIVFGSVCEILSPLKPLDFFLLFYDFSYRFWPPQPFSDLNARSPLVSIPHWWNDHHIPLFFILTSLPFERLSLLFFLIGSPLLSTIFPSFGATMALLDS